MIDDLVIPCDRVTFRDGQRLTSRDLRDVRRRHDRLRRLHHRVLHDTWGIALGFEVSQVDAAGGEVDAGGTAVVVGPGYAVDDSGRELLLAENVQVPVPRVSGPGPAIRVLTVRHQDDAAFHDLRDDLAAVCPGTGLDRRLERPLFAWRRQEESRLGEEVPVTQAELTESGIVGTLDPRVRRFARPAVRPYMVRGSTEPGRTGWRPWMEAGGSKGLEVVVDTSEAGFADASADSGAPPLYFATLSGDFGNRADQDPVSTRDVWAGTPQSFFLDALGFIDSASTTSFTYRLLQVDSLPLQLPDDPAKAESRRWTISWLGLETVRGCEPALDLGSQYSLSGLRLFFTSTFASFETGDDDG